jgi:GMP synthase-like glutamine amidotransferase
MSDVLLVQNTRIEGSGYLGELLTEDGFNIQSVHAKHESLPEKQYSLVVVLGAPESANDNLPYLQEEQKLIKQSVEQNTPVLGICLGSQLIAKKFTRVQKKRLGFTMI